MSSNFSKKLKAKKTSDTDVKNIREELKNVPDNGILEDIKAPYEAVNKREEENTSDTIKNKPDDITENQSESIINDKIEAADIAAPVESLSENISESAASDKTDTEENRPDKTVSYDKAPYPDMPYTSSESGSMFWNCRLSQDLVDKLEYNIFIHDSSIKEFMNTIIMEEKHFYDRYSSMITTDIIKKNLKNRYIYDNNKVKKGFTLYPECKAVLEIYPKKYGMTMTAFIEHIINKYCE